MYVSGARNHVLTQLATFAAYTDEPLMAQAIALDQTASEKAEKAPVLLTVRKSGLN